MCLHPHCIAVDPTRIAQRSGTCNPKCARERFDLQPASVLASAAAARASLCARRLEPPCVQGGSSSRVRSQGREVASRRVRRSPSLCAGEKVRAVLKVLGQMQEKLPGMVLRKQESCSAFCKLRKPWTNWTCLLFAETSGKAQSFNWSAAV